jgi:hypothetical protein
MTRLLAGVPRTAWPRHRNCDVAGNIVRSVSRLLERSRAVREMRIVARSAELIRNRKRYVSSVAAPRSGKLPETLLVKSAAMSGERL